ncbi:hypothetical protein JOQ06_027309 [Pogonophryne albipinna]|uniref:Uncharacterized protein n=1 Tax=Pogonophryne albipinna TaxID=1090488 RepID=A0AAD6FNK2_9TELE|nr:hypothetical protein JOQ06_027309 [Pogonophryne albipinna]
MYPRDGASAGSEETGAKAGVLGPGLSLLQQVGCWHLNLNSWWPQGRCWASVPQGPPGAALASAGDKVDATACAMITWHVESEQIEDIGPQEVS